MEGNELSWFCAQTRRAREESVREAFAEELRMVAYLPLERVMRKKRGNREPIDRPLIPRHLFFATATPDSSVFEAVRAVRGVSRILSIKADGSPSKMRWRDIAIFQTAEGELLDKFNRRWLRDQEAERSADDTELVIERLKGAQPEERVAILYELIGRGKKARLKLEDVQILVGGRLQSAA